MRHRHLSSALVLAALAVLLIPAIARSALSTAPTIETLVVRDHAGGAATAVAAADHLLLAAFGTTVRSYDLANPLVPAQRAELRLGAPVRDLALAGPVAYALTPGSLLALDVADPAAPRRLGALPLPGASPRALALDSARDIVYVAGASTVSVVDMSAPTSPTLLATIAPGPETLLTAPDVMALRGGVLYLAASSELLTYDVSDARVPRLGSRTQLSLPVLGVGVVGDYLYLSATSQIDVLRLSDPLRPRIVGTLAGTAAYDLTPIGPYALGLNNGSLVSLDASTPTAPRTAAQISVGEPGSSTPRIAIAAGYAYVAIEFEGVHIIDIGTPATPAKAARIDPRPAGGPLTLNGSYLYARNTVLDISDLGTLKDVGAYEGTMRLISGGRGFAGGRDEPLRIYSLADPKTPALLGSLPFNRPISGIAASGDYLYISSPGVCLRLGCAGGGLYTVSVATPAQPMQVAYDKDLVTGSIVSAGPYLYAASGQEVKIFSLANPAQPAAAGAAGTIGGQSVTQLALAGSRLYVLTSGELQIFDLTTPTTPRAVGRVVIPGDQIAVAEPFVYVENDGELQIVDVQAPERPVLRGARLKASEYRNRDEPTLAVAGDRIFLGNQGVMSVQRVTVALPNATYLPLIRGGGSQ